MAIYHLQAKVIQRSKGRSVVAAAAYRAAEALYDAELGRTQRLFHKSDLSPNNPVKGWGFCKILAILATSHSCRRLSI